MMKDENDDDDDHIRLMMVAVIDMVECRRGRMKSSYFKTYCVFFIYE